MLDGNSLVIVNESYNEQNGNTENQIIYDAGLNTSDGNPIQTFNLGELRIVLLYINKIYFKAKAPLKNRNIEFKMAIIENLGDREMKMLLEFQILMIQ